MRLHAKRFAQAKKKTTKWNINPDQLKKYAKFN
jgi:hypothetical protein